MLPPPAHVRFGHQAWVGNMGGVSTRLSVWDDPVNVCSCGIVPLDCFRRDRDLSRNEANMVVALKCPYCGGNHMACPLVKSLEYYPDGAIKRVEFKDENLRPDYRSTPITGVLPVLSSFA